MCKYGTKINHNVLAELKCKTCVQHRIILETLRIVLLPNITKLQAHVVVVVVVVVEVVVAVVIFNELRT